MPKSSEIDLNSIELEPNLLLESSDVNNLSHHEYMNAVNMCFLEDEKDSQPNDINPKRLSFAINANNDNNNNLFNSNSDQQSINSKKNSIPERPAIEWSELESVYGKKVLGRKISTSTRVVRRAYNCCDGFSFIGWLLSLFPIITWIRKYSFKHDFLADVVGGLTVSVLQIPQGMAYGLLAGLGAIHGLYVSFFPVIIYAIMGTSKHLSIGTFSVASIMVKNIIEKVSHEEGNHFNMTHLTNSSSNFNSSTDAAIAVCLLNGALMIAMGLLKLGSLSLILSDQIISGFSCGVALHVAVSQLPSLFDLTLKRRSNSPLSLIYVK